ncbi:MAG: TonB-dependent receptor plug domain-containing protein [Bacteroidia bacterium]
MKKVIAFVWTFVAVSVEADAQQAIADTAKQLHAVEITSNRLENFATGSKTERPDSITRIVFRNQSLADLLQNENVLYIKSQGSGSLATSSFRGAGAEHTAVLWNGFNLQSPMNGQIDFSIFQNDFVDELKIQYGSSSALYGSGAVGGVIHLENKPKFESDFHSSVNMMGGSFGNVKESFQFSFGSKRIYSSVRFFNQNITNDFTYHNDYLPGAPLVTQTNAFFQQQGIFSDNYFLITKYQQINFRVWYQNALRQIPPPMSVPASSASQQDENLRISSEWKLQQRTFSVFIRAAFFDDRLVYKDSSTGLISHSHSQTIISEAESKISVSKNQFVNLGVNNTFTNATVENYGNTYSQNRSSFFSSYKIFSPGKKLQMCFNLREELVDGNWLPIMPSYGFEWKMNELFNIFGSVNRAYRIPPMNYLYWNEGVYQGNKNLRPEDSWSEEISLNMKENISIINFDVTATIYNRLMNDYIQWISSGVYFMPVNVSQVWSRGTEGSLNIKIPLGKIFFSYTGKINYGLSTKEQSQISNDQTLHQQIIYVPRLNYSNQLSIIYKAYFVNFSQTYTGIRFTQADHSDWLMYYVLVNFACGYEFAFSHFKIDLNAQVKNIGDVSYQSVENYAMPGRNYLIGITLKI